MNRRYEYVITVEADQHLVGTERGTDVAQTIYAPGFWDLLNGLRGVKAISSGVRVISTAEPRSALGVSEEERP